MRCHIGKGALALLGQGLMGKNAQPVQKVSPFTVNQGKIEVNGEQEQPVRGMGLDNGRRRSSGGGMNGFQKCNGSVVTRTSSVHSQCDKDRERDNTCQTEEFTLFCFHCNNRVKVKQAYLSSDTFNMFTLILRIFTLVS